MIATVAKVGCKSPAHARQCDIIITVHGSVRYHSNLIGALLIAQAIKGFHLLILPCSLVLLAVAMSSIPNTHIQKRVRENVLSKHSRDSLYLAYALSKFSGT